MSLKTRRTAFVVSGIASVALLWLYSGLYPLGSIYGIFPPGEGTMLNTLMRVIALPLALLLIAGGGMAAAHAVSSEDESELQRLLLAVSAPPGILWIFVLGSAAVRSMWLFNTVNSMIYAATIAGLMVAAIMLVVNRVQQQRVLTN